jgi:tRNA dimethylallyltransferase
MRQLPSRSPIAILGPTGSGKSALALRLTQHLPVEIISVDSAQVFRGMDIGTAKPSLAERQRTAHHLVDIRDPEQVYSAGEFCADCASLVEQIQARGKVPVLVGGSMLYFRSLFRGIAALPTANATVRQCIDARAAEQGWPTLHNELAKIDPQAAARIHNNDGQRIQRALEVISLSGRPLSSHWVDPGSRPDFSHWRICVLEPGDRSRLHGQLAARLADMFAQGLVEEVRGLMARKTLDEHSPALRLVGYRQVLAHCRGLESRERAQERSLFATRQLAKRQMTWLRSAHLLPDGAQPHRIDPFNFREVEQLLSTLIKSGATP